jgi:hypothetical protein
MTQTDVDHHVVNEARRNSRERLELAVTAWPTYSSRPAGLRRAKRCEMTTGSLHI